jgi:CubicO group peptidase (beta-lactamase class C family)
VYTAIAVFSNVVAISALLAAPTKASIEHTIERAMDEFGVPGMAVSVVHDGEVVYSAGHGILETGSDDPVDDRNAVPDRVGCQGIHCDRAGDTRR